MPKGYKATTKKVWKMITLGEATKKALDDLRIHPKESYEDIIKKLIEIDFGIKVGEKEDSITTKEENS